MKGLLSFPDHGGNLGPADFAISFKPPNGLGIAIDAGVVAGGGYILFDPDKGQYAGVLDVALAEIVQVKVIAVLDTMLPDGSSGFSFLLIITFDFPPIQLGFGFTLNGVGGSGWRQPHDEDRRAARRVSCAHAQQRSVPARSYRQCAADHQQHRELLPAGAKVATSSGRCWRSAGEHRR